MSKNFDSPIEVGFCAAVPDEPAQAKDYREQAIKDVAFSLQMNEDSVRREVNNSGVLFKSAYAVEQRARVLQLEEELAKARNEVLEEAAKAVKNVPACPFDGPCNLEPHEACPVCGDKGDDLNAPSNCQSPLIIIRALMNKPTEEV